MKSGKYQTHTSLCKFKFLKVNVLSVAICLYNYKESDKKDK